MSYNIYFINSYQSQKINMNESKLLTFSGRGIEKAPSNGEYKKNCKSL